MSLEVRNDNVCLVLHTISLYRRYLESIYEKFSFSHRIVCDSRLVNLCDEDGFLCRATQLF